MKRKAQQPRLLFPAKVSFRFQGQIKSFPDKKKQKEFIITKSTLNELLKDLLQEEENQKHEQ